MYKNAHQLRENVKQAKINMMRGDGSEQQFNQAADAYIAVLQEFKREKKAKIAIPTRAQLFRQSL